MLNELEVECYRRESNPFALISPSGFPLLISRPSKLIVIGSQLLSSPNFKASLELTTNMSVSLTKQVLCVLSMKIGKVNYSLMFWKKSWLVDVHLLKQDESIRGVITFTLFFDLITRFCVCVLILKMNYPLFAF